MSRVATIKVEYESDLNSLKQQWDQYRAYVDAHPITVNGIPINSAGTPGAPSVSTTFGGLSTVGPSPQSAAAVATAVAVGAAVSQGLRQVLVPPGQSTVSPRISATAPELEQMFGVAMDVGRGSGVPVTGRSRTGGLPNWYRSWFSDSMRDQPNDLSRLQFARDEIRLEHERGSQRGVDWLTGRASRVYDRYEGDPNAIVRYAGGGGSGSGAGGSRLPTQYISIPGAAGGGGGGPPGSDWPDIVDDGDGGGGGNDNIGWRYRPGRGRQQSQRGIGWQAAAAGVYAAERTVSGVNSYNIAMAGATTAGQAFSAWGQNMYGPIFSNMPLVNTAMEFFLGGNQRLAGMAADWDSKMKRSALGNQMEMQYRSVLDGTQLQTGQATGRSDIVRLGIEMQRLAQSQNLNQTYAVEHQKHQADIIAIKLAAGGTLQPDGSVTGESLSDEAKNNIANINKDDSMDSWTRYQLQQQNDFTAAQHTAYSNYDLATNRTSVGYGIDARNRETVAKGYAGRMMPRSAAALSEISEDTQQVQAFNLSHAGPDWIDRRQSNLQSVLGSQQKSYDNLQFLGQIPGNAQEVSGYTMFGDFSNQGYKDYKSALELAKGGGATIQAGSDQANKDAESNFGALQRSIDQATQVITQAMSVISGYAGGVYGAGF